MRKFKADNYYSIQGWMRSELNLKGNELLIFALINGFSQDNASKFSGSLAYIEQAVGAARPTVVRALNSLENKGLITKIASKRGNQYLTSYKTLLVTKCNQTSNETLPEVVTKCNQTSNETLPNNIYTNTNNNKYNTTTRELAPEQEVNECIQKELRENGYGNGNSFIISTLASFLQQVDIEIIIYAIQQGNIHSTATQNKRNLGYVKSVIKNRIEGGITTKEALEAELKAKDLDKQEKSSDNNISAYAIFMSNHRRDEDESGRMG